MKLGIGTAQFGLDYGISNREGKTPPEEVARILDFAAQKGVRAIDTAPLYGTSEAVLGQTLPCNHKFDIVTKTPQFSKTTIISDDAEILENTFCKSLEKMRQSSLYGLLVHRVDDLFAENGHLLIDKMLEIKQRGLVKKIGVSVYTGEQIDRVLERYTIDLIQLPINLLDQRLLSGGYLQKLKMAGIEIHARSVFLQGLLLMETEDLPPYFNSIKDHLQTYHKAVLQQGLSLIEAALSFAIALDEIDVVVCGVNCLLQLQELIKAISEISHVQRDNWSQFSILDDSLLNPSRWSL